MSRQGFCRGSIDCGHIFYDMNGFIGGGFEPGTTLNTPTLDILHRNVAYVGLGMYGNVARRIGF